MNLPVLIIPGPDGKTEPVVIAAGSGEDFERAWEEGGEFAASDRAKASDASPELLRANYALLRMAEMSGLLPRVLLIRGAQMAQGMLAE